jgi:phospholipid/cholesterol/gamma-HCH transport system substrate-binding protein
MERRAQFLLVALFLLVAIGGVFGFINWITPDQEESLEQRLVQFNGSVSGLSVGSAVRYLGVPVGRVLAIGLSPERAGRVDVTIGVDEPLPDSDTLLAMLEPQGITGLALVELRNRKEHSETADVAPGVIPGQISVLGTLSESAKQLTARAEEALSRVNALLSAQTVEDFSATASQLRGLVSNLSTASADTDELLASLGRVSAELEATLPAYRSLATRLETELIPVIVDTGRSVQATADQLTAGVGDNRRELEQLLQQDLPSLVRLGDEVAVTLREMTRLARNVNNQPGALLHGTAVQEADIPLE